MCANRLKSPLCSLLCFMLLAAMASTANAQETIGGKAILQGTWQGRQIEYVEGEIAIILESEMGTSAVQTLVQEYDATFLQNFDGQGWGLIELPEEADVLEIAEELAEDENIRSAEPNMVIHTMDDTNDPYYTDGHQWALKNTGQSPPGGTSDADIDAPEAWHYTMGGTSDTIAILDTGIPMQNNSLSHPDLDASSKFILGPDYVGDGNSVKDNNGHGTHVTGIASAETNNSTGISGVAGNCKILVIQVFNYYGSGTWSYFYNGVVYAVNHGVKVINFSGSGGSSSTAELAVEYADDHDVILVAAAGNYGSYVRWPAAYSSDYSNVIAVGATDADDNIASYSDVGPEINVVAPGGYGGTFDSDDIYSTMPNYTVYLNIYYGVSQNYGYLAGTSMATPHVTGLAAMVLDICPSKTPAQVREIIEKSADDLGPTGFDTTYGYGRINEFYAVAPPDVPTNLSLTRNGNDNPVLDWDAPAAPDVKNYRIKRRMQGFGGGFTTTYFTTTSTTWTDTDISTYGTYWIYYSVRAEDYTDQYSSYTSEVSTRFDGGIGSDGSGAQIALNPTSIPEEFTLDAPAPNPFNASTTVRFGLPATGNVRLDIYDISGRHVTTLLDKECSIGWHTISWNAQEVASGTYFLLARMGSQVWNRKLTVIK